MTGSPSSLGLPDELLAESVKRLGWAGVSYAVCYVAAHFAYRFSSIGLIADRAFYDVLLAVSLSMGLGLFWATRTFASSARRLLLAGLAFEVATSLLVSLAENQHSYAPGESMRGFSALAAWIPVFSFLVPVGPVASAVAAFTSAAMGPLGLWLQVTLHGVTPPLPRDLPAVFVPPFLMAGVAVVLAQTIYRLGMRVSQEKAMGSYRLVEPIGQGGMGQVWRAEHRLLAREAAIKLISPSTGGESVPVVRQRFEREARAISALQSPHTVTLFDYGVTEEGRLYYVMELLRGFDLDDLVTKYGPLPPARAAHLVAQMCASLEEAHAAGLTHRDIKPRNALVCRLGAESDFVKVLDFGLVKQAAGAEDLRITRPESTTGTPAFMAPEVALGVDFDGRADIYSLGCTAYWLLTGRFVFEGKTATSMLMEHVNSAPVPPSGRVETPVPAGLDRLVLECLAKDPALRPRSAAELRHRLREWAVEWTPEMAAAWWKTHQPERVAAVPLRSANATTV